MKITKILGHHVRIPLKYPVKWSGGIRHSAPAYVIEIHTDEGIVGLGECVGPTIPTVATIVNEEFSQLLIGQDPLNTELLVRRLEEFARNYLQLGAYAISGIEMALYDIKGKWMNVPVFQLLGGKCKSKIEYAGYLFIDEPEINAKRALEFKMQGYKELKIKVGRNLNQDADSLAAIRDAIGYGVKIRIDANMNWSVPTAIKWIKTLQKYDIQYVEQPVPDYDLDGLATVRRAVDVPIATDESCSSVERVLEMIKRDACDVFVVYVSESGGLSRARTIASIADACGKWCVMGTWAETGVATIAGAHVIASTTNFAFCTDTHYMLQTDDILTNPLQIANGAISLSDKPGLGVELDLHKLEDFKKCDVRESVFYDNISDETMPRIGQII
jgi:L-alanine-DL-glutamate epimerase-like enolase superfamily enzyme